MNRILSLLLMLVIGILFSPVQAQDEVRFEGKEIFFTLKENPTTGYLWSYTIEPEGMLSCAKDHYQPDAASRFADGGGGCRQYVFQAGGDAGIAAIRLILEGPGGVYREMAFEVRVGEAGVERVERMHAAAVSIEEIENITLTLSPSFGLPEEMVDTVMVFSPDAALVALLNDKGFFDMPEYIDTGVMDGRFTWITVNLRNGESKRVGGLEAEEFGPEDFIMIYDAVINAQEILYSQSQPVIEEGFRLSVFPTGTTAESYYFELSQDGVLFCAVGVRAGDDITQPVFLMEIDHSADRMLNASDLQLLIGLCNEIERSGYDTPKKFWTDAWDVALLYKGTIYEMVYWDSDGSVELKELVSWIIELSPIPVDLHGWA